MPNLNCPSINDELKNISVDILKNFRITKRYIEDLKSANFLTLGDLTHLTTSIKDRIFTKAYKEYFNDSLAWFQLDFKSFFEKLLEMKAKEQSFTMLLFRAQGYTLQEIGNMQQVTRERIRQMTDKLADSLYPIADELARIYGAKGFITVQELIDIYDNDDYDAIILEVFKSYKEKWEYLDFAQVFVPIVQDQPSVSSKVTSLILDFIGDSIDLAEKGEEFCAYMAANGAPYIDLTALKNFAPEHRYNVHKEHIIRRRIGYGEICASLIAKKFPQGIKLYELGKDDLDLLRKLVLEEYGDLGLPDNNRALSTRIDSHLYLFDRGLVIAGENLQVDSALMYRIKDAIDNFPATKIPYVELFANFEKELLSSGNIHNRFALQGALQLFFKNEYTYERDHVIKNNTFGTSYGLHERIQDFIRKVNRPVSKNELKAEFKGISDVMFSKLFSESNNIIQWSFNQYYCMNLLKADPSVNVQKLILDTIRKQLKQYNGFTSAYLLFEELKQRIPKFLADNKIVDALSIFYIAQQLYKEKFMFSAPHIATLGSVNELATIHILHKLIGQKTILKLSEYDNISKMYKWPEGTRYMNFGKLIANRIQIDADTFIEEGSFKISADKIKEINEALANTMSEDYLALNKFTDWASLPKLDYAWNAFLLRAVVEKYCKNYKVISSAAIDRRYEKSIIVSNKVPVTNYVELVAYTLNSKGYKEVSEGVMYKLLNNLGFAWQVIPQEVYHGDKVKFVKAKDINKFVINW